MGQTFQGLGSSDPSDMNTPAKLLQGGTKGLAQGFSNMQNQNQQLRQGGPTMPVPMPQQPQVQLPMGQPQRRGPNDLNFYGGQ